MSFLFSLQQNQRTRGWKQVLPRSMGWGGEVAQTMYTHVSGCKNDIIKKIKTTNKNF
jgi:hypothetical protein